MSEVFFSLFELYTYIYLYRINSEKKRQTTNAKQYLFSHTVGIVRATCFDFITKL